MLVPMIRTLSLVGALGFFMMGTASAQCFGPAKHPVQAMHAGALAPSLQGRPVVVRIHADWCPACKATEATLREVRAKYGKAISYVELDVTDGKTSAAAAAEAKRLGLGSFYEANKGQTSTVGILNPHSGAVIATLYADTDVSDYAKAIDRTKADLRRK